jgi:hypothetical protein
VSKGTLQESTESARVLQASRLLRGACQETALEIKSIQFIFYLVRPNHS